ncbi:TBC1 domain member 9 [Phytophthora pseudosyringae]|uniref:TBC1 domain member 9 n=1 Tax=Phytophthora pseudosyringae TaxID=221518 RepID=A0A8T1VH45_9STRA|nr:TBC1 domain member 9 [Phytophthora pseudosyringae]
MEDELATGVMLSPTRNVSKDGEIVRRWMEMVLGDKFLDGLPAALHSGELLCDLVNKLYKALGMKSQISPARAEADGMDALSNVLEYLRACEVLGVAHQDLFQPDDLLQRQDMEKVYSNILALQSVAVSLSNRRSIDERSSMINAPDWSPMSEHGVFVDDEDLDSDDLDLESPEAIYMLQQSRWQRLLFEYEHQQQRKEERDLAGDSSASDGLGPLAHGIWRTEERIRAILIRDDREFGAVPEDLHGKLWMLASGAQLVMRKNKGQYERLLASEAESTEATRQIDVDLHRTVADEDKELWTEEKSRMLRRVLVAYSFYNPGLGYCQGLNYIVARSLQHLDEEEAFYLLIAIVRLVPDDYYTTMLGLAVDQHVFADLVRLQYPEVSEHLTELGGSGMELSLACTEWFLTLFASPCEREVTFQIWDAIFLQGDEVLFRVALALLQQAKTELLACNTYGDMLKHLNELGRGALDALALLKISRKQDCVIRGRIEDFRAHHRLQLASGIVASTVEADDARSSTTGRRSSESRSEPRLRIFGRKKQGIFRHMDKIPPRLARTFDRHLTDEYTLSIRRDHPNVAEYYDGMQLHVKEDYWGSADSYRQWGARNVRRISTDGFAVSSTKEKEGRRMKSDTNLVGHRKSPNGSDAIERGPGLTRDRRSKSSAFIQARKIQSTSANSTPNGRSVKDNDEDSQQIGRSPLAWIQRFEEWHKDMKTQKEKKKAEKRLRRNQRSESLFPVSRNGADSGTPWLRGTIDSSPVPLCPQPKNSQSIEAFSLGHRRRSNEHQHPPTESIAMLEEPSLSRSYSDPFRSPAGIAGQRQHQSTIEKTRRETEQVPMLPQHPFKRDVDGVPQKPDFDEVRKLGRSGSGRTSRGFSDQSTLSRSTNSYVNTASFTLDPQEEIQYETSSNPSVDEKNSKQEEQGQSPTLALLEKPLAHELLYSPVHCRSSSVDFAVEAPSACAQPQIRRIVSVPVDDTYAQQKRPRNPKRDCSQAIRERANVLQYMHRKASDASSIAGSIPRSPARMSESSSDSSRFGDHTSNRSGKSMHFRKSSFSFFDKLSSDLENSTHGLDSLVDESEFKTESIGRGSMSSVATGRSSTVDEQRPMGGAISISS